LNLHKMLCEDEALTLVEITKNMFWLDITMGLFEGWWLFEDGRSHALTSETHWERCMKEAGFREVAWTNESTPEAQMVRIIAGFPWHVQTLRAPPKRARGRHRKFLWKQSSTSGWVARQYMRMCTTLFALILHLRKCQSVSCRVWRCYSSQPMATIADCKKL
jgi:hypothetical protein